jgi:hypothetical protein
VVNIFKNTLVYYLKGNVEKEKERITTSMTSSLEQGDCVEHFCFVPKTKLQGREKVRSKRINLEGNTHAQEINVSQCPV